MTTRDFGLITALAAKGCRYADYRVDQLERIWFSYPDSHEVEAVKAGFYNNTLAVPVQDFINAQTTMKTLIFEIKRSKNAYATNRNGGRTADLTSIN